MSKTLFIDASEGMAGDMLVAALIDLGVDHAEIASRLRGLRVQGFETHVETVMRGPFRALHFRVSPQDGSGSISQSMEKEQPLHAHEEPRFDHQPHRHWRDIRQLLNDSRTQLGHAVVDRASMVFECLARAEARVHGIEPEEVHFHEVGAVDSIVDIVSVCIALELLGIDHIVASPLPLSSGRVRTAHGTISLPAPATVEILKGWPVTPGRVGLEQVTPTGAALIRTLSDAGSVPRMTLLGSGVGGGTANPSEWPNIVRVLLGETVPEQSTAEEVDVLSAHMDDLTGEHLPGLIHAVMDAGALDAFATPILMKKGRTGLWVQVLVHPSYSSAVGDALLAHGSSFGLRRVRASRTILDRWHETVSTRYGDIRVKIGARDGKVLHASPEFEDVRGAAESCKVPIPHVHSAAVAAWHSLQEEQA